jgi:outer membrane lipoprotein-sorting protein
MKKNTAFYFLLIALIAIPLLGLRQTNAPNVREIIQKMESQMRGETAQMEVTMTITRPRYTREMSMKSWALGDDYSLILITAPARDRGTAFLKRKKEIWNYLPSVDRMIKLPPSMMSQSWMGSDFSNDDLVRESSTIDDFSHRIIKEENLLGMRCWVIEMIPKPTSSVVYSKVLIWVSQNTYFHLKSENYDERGQIVSSITLSEIENIGNRQMPTRMEMIPHDKPGHKTTLKYTMGIFNEPMSPDFFSVQNLKSVR